MARARVALVTGGTRGIGAAIAIAFAREGAAVVVTGTGATPAPPGLELVRIDLTDRPAVDRFAEAVAERRIDVLVNNAGINAISPFEAIDPADFDRIHDVNVRAPMLLCRAVVPGMRQRGFGRIVNISSIFGTIARAERGAYCASKFALDGLTAALAAEVAAWGILANCVAPGYVETELTRRILGEAGMAAAAQAIPLGRLARPEEIAELVAWLASERNTYVSGQTIIIDGGLCRV